MICHCDACGQTFNAAVLKSKYDIPCKCPYCKKKTLSKFVPAVRAATDDEIKDLRREQAQMMETVYEVLNGNHPSYE